MKESRTRTTFSISKRKAGKGKDNAAGAKRNKTTKKTCTNRHKDNSAKAKQNMTTKKTCTNRHKERQTNKGRTR